MRTALIIAILALSTSLVGCSQDNSTGSNTTESSATENSAMANHSQEDISAMAKVAQQAVISAGEKLFNENCTECHSREGRGDYIKRIPVTLLTRRSGEELMAWIKGSNKHREMPSFEHLSDSERQALAEYLLSQITQ